MRLSGIHTCKYRKKQQRKVTHHLYSSVTVLTVCMTKTFSVSKDKRQKCKENGCTKICYWYLYIFWGSMAQWLARQTSDAVVVSSIPLTAHVVIALGKQFTYIPSVGPSVKWVLGHRQLKRLRYCNALKYELSLLCREKEAQSWVCLNAE